MDVKLVCLIVCVLILREAVCQTVVNNATGNTKSKISHRKSGSTGQGNYSICGDGKCRCTVYYADCSNKGGTLTYIPRLPQSVRVLNFSHNRLLKINRDDFFYNVTNVTKLLLGGNGLRFILPAAFKPLKSLTTLDLSDNNLTYERLAPALSVRSLHSLVLSGDGLGNVPVDIFHRYPLPRLKAVYLNGNLLTTLNMSVFAPLTEIRSLPLYSNRISSLETYPLPKLTFLNIGNNTINAFPKTCHNTTSSFFPALQMLFIRYSQISAIPSKVCLPSLRDLDMGAHGFRQFTTGMFSDDRFENLRSLYLGNSVFRITVMERYAFNNSKLLKLSLMHGGIDFSLDTVSPESFAGCSSLHTLQLGHNNLNLKEVSTDKFQRLLRPLPGLVRLHMGSCKLNTLKSDTFMGLTSLREIYVYDNALISLPDGVFDSVTNLNTLVLYNNQIGSVRETTFSEATRRRLTYLDLSRNPLMCNCELLWFQNWYKSDTELFTNKWHDRYVCANVPNTTLGMFYVNKQSCLLSRAYNVLTIVCVVLLLFTFTVVLLFYRYRWHIRLLLYEASRGRGDRWRHLQAGQFQYDVFVSYAEEDTDWVMEHLLPELEERQGLKLCIHQRDFIPGRHIVDNIVKSVESSKKVMMLFSVDFAKSPWCQFELALCLTHVMEQDDALVITCLQDIPSRDLTASMMAVMKTTTYIEWTDDPDAVASFWGRLVIALQEILPVLGP